DSVARRVDAAGNVSAPVNIFTDADNTLADFSELTTLANQNFVAVFQVTGADANNHVFYTIRNNAGDQIVAPTAVAATTNQEISPHVAALADGGFVVTWTDTTTAQVRAAVYNANGTLAHGSLLVNFFNQTGDVGVNDVTALPDGGFITAWEDNAGNAVRAQRFDEAGNLVGTSFVFSNNRA